MGKVVTFYSYKGGTGRSMALANVAWLLASQGSRVLVVDWDLEAPGLHRYFRPFLSDKELTRFESQGVIDFMSAFVERTATRMASQGQAGRWEPQEADISKWSQRLLWPTGEDAETVRGGSIDFVPAGRQGPQYASKVNSFDWAGTYERLNGGAFMESVRESMIRYDWTLIDSRTGVSDTSGICTVQLPDTLVVCFTLNYQSIDGAASVAASALQSRTSRPLKVLPVPTRLDGNEEKLLKMMLAYARSAFDDLLDPILDHEKYWRETGVPYFSRYAYSEKLAPFEDNVNVSTSTLPAMERLTSYIVGRDVTLQALPEPHRTEVLREFERSPDDREGLSRDLTGTLGRSWWQRWGVAAGKFWRTINAQGIAASVLVALVLVVAATMLFRQQASPGVANSGGITGPTGIIQQLTADVRKALDARDRNKAGLLVAEAASRLDPAAVVGPEGEPGQLVYQALLALEPFTICCGDPRPSSGAAQRVQGAVPRNVQISPDGRWLVLTAAEQANELYRFPPQRAAAIATAIGVTGWSVAAFSPDGRYLAAGGRDGTVVVYDVETGRLAWESGSVPRSASITAVVFSPNGNLLAAGTDRGAIVVAQVDAWKVLGQLAQPGAVSVLAFSPDSRYVASAGTDPAARFWTYTRQTPVEVLGPHQGGVYDLAFSAAAGPRRLMTAGRDGTVRVWTQTSANPTQVIVRKATPMDQTGQPDPVAFSPDGSLLAVGASKAVELWPVRSDGDETAQGAQSMVGQPRTIPVAGARALAFSADGKWLVTGEDSAARVWDVTTSALVKSLAAAAVTGVAVGGNPAYVALASRSGSSAAFLRPAGKDLQFRASDVVSLACSQTTDAALSATEWSRYFGTAPLRFTCGNAQATPASPPPTAR